MVLLMTLASVHPRTMKSKHYVIIYLVQDYMVGIHRALATFPTTVRAILGHLAETMGWTFFLAGAGPHPSDN